MVFFDCNNDGYLDMAKTSSDFSWQNLAVNDKDNTFTERPNELGNEGRGITWGDYDNDGDIDLATKDPNILTNNGASDCTSFTKTSPTSNNDESLHYYVSDVVCSVDSCSAGFVCESTITVVYV